MTPLPPGYPEIWESDVVLGDGRPAHIRPIRPDDAERLVAFHARLSAETVYYRFFSAKPRLSPAEVEHFTVLDYHDRFALIVLLDGEIIGVGRYEREPGRPAAEVAFVVDDDQHGRGVATLLLEQLAEAARTNGLRTFTASTLADNRSMLAVFRRAGYAVRSSMDSGVIDLSFSLDPTPEAEAKMIEREARADARSVASLLHPVGVLIISTHKDVGIGHLIEQTALEHGTDIPLHHIELSEGLPRGCDLGIIATAKEEVSDAVDACLLAGIRVILIVATGFDADEQAELVARVRGHGARLVGPSSLGVVSNAADVRLHATVAHVADGSVALSSQSGPLAMALVRRGAESGMGFSSVVMIGDKADISGNDLLQHWEHDPATKVILMYVESFGNPAKFARVARRVSRTKPIVALWAGVGPGDEATVDGLFRQTGVLRAGTTEELLDAGRTLAAQPLPNGRRVGIVTDSGSVALLAERAAQAAGLEVVSVVRVDPPATAPMFRLAAEALAPSCDVLLAIHLPALESDLLGVSDAIAEAAPGLPLLAVMNRLVQHARVTVFEFPEPAVRAMAHLVEAGTQRHDVEGSVRSADGFDQSVFRQHVTELELGITEERELTWVEISDLLSSAGLSLAQGRIVTDAGSAAAAATEVGWPVVIKALGVERLLLAEQGGVAVDLTSTGEVEAAFTRMRRALGERMDQALVQLQAPPGIAVAVSVQHHPVFGPVLGVGPGGAFRDLLSPAAVSILPLTDVDVERLLRDSRIGVLLPSAEAVSALVDLLHRTATLAEALPGMVSLLLNPVLVSDREAAVTWATSRVGPAVPAARRLRRLVDPAALVARTVG